MTEGGPARGVRICFARSVPPPVRDSFTRALARCLINAQTAGYALPTKRANYARHALARKVYPRTFVLLSYLLPRVARIATLLPSCGRRHSEGTVRGNFSSRSRACLAVHVVVIRLRPVANLNCATPLGERRDGAGGRGRKKRYAGQI